jgi:nucleotide-binding universal stress UspA family protein
MSMDPQTITVFLDASPSGDRRARHAVALAQRWGSHIVGVHVVFAGVTLSLSMDFAVGHKAIHSVVAYAQRLDADAEASAAMLAEHFRSLCVHFNVDGEFHPIGRWKTAEEAILSSLNSDLVVVGHPKPYGLPDDMSPENILLTSGVPLLIVPNAWDGPTIGNKIRSAGTRAMRRDAPYQTR